MALNLEKLMKYECRKGPNGCIQIIGKCLEEFLGQSETEEL